MVAFADDNASNRPREKFDPNKSIGTLVGAWLGQADVWKVWAHSFWSHFCFVSYLGGDQYK